MAGERRVIVDILGDASGFEKATKQAQTSASRFSNVLKGVGQGIGIGFTNIVASAASSVVDFAKDSIAAASDQREAWSLTQQVFKTNAAALREWATDKKDAFSTTEAMQFASTFGTAMTSVGMDLDEVTEKSKTLVTLAGDLGSAFDTSSEEAAQALRSGLMGESEPMRRFGVFLSEAAVKAKALEMGMKLVGGQLTDAQKVTARYQIILDQTAESQGMFGRDAGSLADTQKILDNRLKDVSASIGQKFLPAVQNATASLVDLLEALDDLPDPGAWWDDATRGAQDFIDTLPKSEHTLTKLNREAARGARAWDTTAEAMAGYREGAGRATDATGDLAWAATEASSSGGDWARTLRDIARAARDAADRTRHLAREKAILAGDIASVKLELMDERKHLRKLMEIEHPTKRQRLDIERTKGRIAELNDRLEGTREELAALNGSRVVVTVKTHTGTIGGKAAGGEASGLTLVGEQGPELVNLPRGSFVHNNAQTRRMMSGPSIVVNVGGSIIGPSGVDELSNLLARRLRMEGV